MKDDHINKMSFSDRSTEKMLSVYKEI